MKNKKEQIFIVGKLDGIGPLLYVQFLDNSNLLPLGH